MLDTLFTIGQAASALLLVYGSFLVLAPARGQRIDAALEGRILLLKHVRKHA